MIIYDIPFLLLHIAFLLASTIAVVIARIKKKTQIYYVFFVLLCLLVIWNLGQLLEVYSRSFYGHTVMFFVYLYFLGLNFVPITVLFLGLIFSHKKIRFNKNYLLLLIPPVFSYIVLITNESHHLFFVNYSFDNSNMVLGNFFYIHTFFNYLYISIGFYHLLKFSIKNSGFFSKQSFMLCTGIVIPFIINVLTTFRIFKLPSYSTPITFSAAIIFFGLAILKFRFLNVIPIALEKVVDNMSDSFIVVDEDLRIIDYNKPFILLNLFKANRNDNLNSVLYSSQIINAREERVLFKLMKKLASQQKIRVHFQKKIGARHFTIEVSPIFSKREYLGAVFLIKDVTQHKTDLEIIQTTQKQLIERERLVSLGELAAGVAHDINSPLAAVQTIFYVMDNLIAAVFQEGEVSPNLKQVLEQLKNNCSIGSNACQKMAQIVNSVRNHTRNVNAEIIKNFWVDETLHDLELLLNHYFKESRCTLMLSGDQHCMIKGDPGKLTQVLTNLILNAIQAYGATPGPVKINIQKREHDIIISVTDQAGGIDEKYQEGIFKNILTTKGTEGTGLGLYISYAIITGHFRGRIWFESQTGLGTSFFISIPN